MAEQEKISGLRRFTEEPATTADPLAAEMAYRTVLSFIRKVDSEPMLMERGLLMLWAALDGSIDETKIMRGEAVTLLVLREYFSHRGDWTAMRDCIRQRLDIYGIEPPVERAEQQSIFWGAVQKMPVSLCEALNEFAGGTP